MTAPAFDLHRLYQEINAERQRQDLSWAALSRQVGVASLTRLTQLQRQPAPLRLVIEHLFECRRGT